MKDGYSLTRKTSGFLREHNANFLGFVDPGCTMNHKSQVRKTSGSCVPLISSIPKPPTTGGVE